MRSRLIRGSVSAGHVRCTASDDSCTLARPASPVWNASVDVLRRTRRNADRIRAAAPEVTSQPPAAVRAGRVPTSASASSNQSVKSTAVGSYAKDLEAAGLHRRASRRGRSLENGRILFRSTHGAIEREKRNPRPASTRSADRLLALGRLTYPDHRIAYYFRGFPPIVAFLASNYAVNMSMLTNPSQVPAKKKLPRYHPRYEILGCLALLHAVRAARPHISPTAPRTSTPEGRFSCGIQRPYCLKTVSRL